MGESLVLEKDFLHYFLVPPLSLPSIHLLSLLAFFSLSLLLFYSHLHSRKNAGKRQKKGVFSSSLELNTSLDSKHEGKMHISSFL